MGTNEVGMSSDHQIVSSGNISLEYHPVQEPQYHILYSPSSLKQALCYSHKNGGIGRNERASSSNGP